MSKKVYFGNESFSIPSTMSMDEAQEWAADAFPAIAQAEGTEDADGNYVFEKKAGTKG